MKILIAEDDVVTLTGITRLLRNWNYETIPVNNGDTAWEALQAEEAPLIVLTDLMMPGLNGDELCRLARKRLSHKPLHMILMTATALTIEKKIDGLTAGADDYLAKPFDSRELLARLQVGERVLGLQIELRQRVAELEEALAQVKQLQGLLPICVDCKRIRDDQNYWHRVERYISDRTDAAFTHGLCPECLGARMKEVDSRS
jgi:phosphoserine phosphatase RsbU/P